MKHMLCLLLALLLLFTVLPAQAEGAAISAALPAEIAAFFSDARFNGCTITPDAYTAFENTVGGSFAFAVVASGSTILLYAGKEPSPDKETMPDLTNLSYQTARDRMAALGLYIKTNSSITDTAQIVSGQTVAAGTQLDHGTVVEVTLVTSDSSMLGRY